MQELTNIIIALTTIIVGAIVTIIKYRIEQIHIDLRENTTVTLQYSETNREIIQQTKSYHQIISSLERIIEQRNDEISYLSSENSKPLVYRNRRKNKRDVNDSDPNML